MVEYVLLPAAALKGCREFRVERTRDGLDPLIYSDIKSMHHDYENDIVRNPFSHSTATSCPEYAC